MFLQIEMLKIQYFKMIWEKKEKWMLLLIPDMFYKSEIYKKIPYFSMIWAKKLNECYFCLPDYFQIWNMLKIHYFSLIEAKKLK